MHVNENYEISSDLQDSIEDSLGQDPSIRAVDLYQLNESVSEGFSCSQQDLEIDHELD